MRNLFKTSFPLLLDEYVSAYFANFLLSQPSSCSMSSSTFFELMGDIIRNQTPFVTVGLYLFNLIPYIISAVTPLCSLLAVLVTFGALNRASELTAMKATGISLYRVVAPILVLAAVLAACLFAFNESYLPAANRRQQLLRAEIKNKPALTFNLAGRKWISGHTDKAGDPERIFYYQAFHAEGDSAAFANLSGPRAPGSPKPSPCSAGSTPKTSADHCQPLGLRQWLAASSPAPTPVAECYAQSERVCYQPFTVQTFPEIREQPAYFQKEYKPSDEMSYSELRDYIADLRQSGTFDTLPLRVQLDNKLSVPVITLASSSPSPRPVHGQTRRSCGHCHRHRRRHRLLVGRRRLQLHG